MQLFKYLALYSLILISFLIQACSEAPGSGEPPSATGANVTSPTGDTSYFTVSPTSGVVALTVNFNATQSAQITNYSWDFGDNSFDTGPSTVHVYNTPGSYTTRLTVTDSSGTNYSAERTVHVFASLDNSSVIVPDSITFYDDFDYAAGRDDVNAAATFRNVGGWNGAKTVQSGEPGARGYVYTVDRIPGYSGPFPGRNSTRVLVQEASGATMGGQTDFYLEYGDESASDETIPGNVWFQFWVYPNYYDDPNNQEDQLSEFGHRMKFIYPCRGGYPCHDGSWLFMLGTTSNQPFFNELGVPGQDLYLNLADFEDMDYTLDAQYPENNWKLGHTDLSELLAHNRWTLVKMHVDTSTTAGRWEAWLKPMGGEWVKVADWANGQAGLNWNVSVPGGHRVFRMPTTIGGGNGWYDSWLYMDDFAMATSENDLPVYPY